MCWKPGLTNAKPKASIWIWQPQLLWNYRFRISRIFSGQGQAVNEAGIAQLDTFYGGIEVSFLVLPS
jgi:hypothetical protein